MKKFIKWTFIILGIVFILLLLAPFIFKDKIISAVKSEANKNINAKFDFAGLDLSLIRNFPNLSVNIEKLSVINFAPFEGDTLIYAESFRLTVDIMSVIRGSELQINKVSIDKSTMNFLVNEKERANWDIAKEDAGSDPSDSSSFKGSLKNYSVSDSKIIYHDKTMPFLLKLEGVNHSGSGDFTQDLFELKTKSEIKQTSLAYGGIGYINKASATIHADLDMDMKNMKFTFKENKIILNELALAINGWVAMPDTNIDMDLTFNTPPLEFKNFISIIPAMYSDNFNELKSSGKMDLGGFIKGRYNGNSMPGFGIKLNIENGMFKYPSLPSSVQNVFVNLAINNADGIPDHTVINLSRFHVEMNGDPFDAKLLLKNPVSDPDIDAFFKGKIDLAGIQKFVPLEKGTTLSGIINADVTAKGRMSSIEKRNFEQFTAKGNFGVTTMQYTSADMKHPFLINSLRMGLTPQRVSLDAFDARSGTSDFKATGSIDNFLAFALKDEKLSGNVMFISQRINLNELMTTENDDSAEKDTASLSVLEIPANIDFTLNAGIAKLIYQNMEIDGINGKIVIRDKAIRLQDVIMYLLNGSMSLNGSYSSANIKVPAFDFNINIKDFDIQKTVNTIESVEKLAPIAKNCNGRFSSDLAVKANLDGQMKPVMNTLEGAGKLSTGIVTITNFPVFTKIAETLKMDSWKKIEIPPVNPSFKFSNGRVYVDPFEMNINGIKSTVAGSNGFDQTIDYTMASQIPRAAFGGAANDVLTGLVSNANKKGMNFSVGDFIPVNITIGGTVSNPKIGTDLSKAGANVMDDLKAKAKEEFDKKKEEAEAKVREEAEKFKKEAASKVEQEKQKVEAEADRLKKEAEAKAKAKSDSLKKEAEKKAQEKLKQLNPFKK